MERVDNLNPTILNAADLPTRKPAEEGLLGSGGGSGNAATKKPDIYDGTIFAPSISSYAAALDDPFAVAEDVDDPMRSASPSSEEDNEANVLEEPIDEQEIYGSSNKPHTNISYRARCYCCFCSKNH